MALNVVAEKFSEPEAHVQTRAEKQYTKVLEDYLQAVTFLVGLILCMLLFRLPYQAATEVAGALEMEDDEAALVIPPIARILDKLNLSPSVRRVVLSSGDYIGLVAGLTTYAMRTSEIITQVRGSIQYAQQSGQPVTREAQQESSNGNVNSGSRNLGVYAGFGSYK